MSKTKPDADTRPAEDTSPDITTALIESANRQTELMELLAANQPRKRKTHGEVLVEMMRRQFKYPLFQNGIQAQARGLSDDTIRKAATLAPGRYLNDIVEVVRSGRDKDQRIFLIYDTMPGASRMLFPQPSR